MNRKLTPKSTLENLKKEAKRWLKALRANDKDARARLERAYPAAPATPGLRDVQHALALEHGLEGWPALKAQLSNIEPIDERHAERAALFLEHACPDWHVNGPNAHARARNAADRILRRHPEIAHDSIHTAVVCGDLAEVERILADRPEAASEKGGVRGWPPLLYLCSTRLPLAAANDNAPAIARALLDRGADPNAYYPGGSPQIRYTALTTAVGEGEGSAPPHPQRQALAELLLERGAEPYDIQVFYNTHFHGDIVWLLELVYRHSVRIGRKADWDDPEWSMIDMGGYGFGARYFLGVAVAQNSIKLAEWLLDHGANPNAAQKPQSKMPQHTLHEQALRRGFTGMADLLVRFGATPSAFVRDEYDVFVEACFRLDRTAAQALLAQHPEYLLAPGAMHAAAKLDRADVVAFLLDLGMSPEIEDPKRGKKRPLHIASMNDSLRVATLLIERGAEIDPVETDWGGTPLSLAVYGQQTRMIELLGRYSREIFPLTAIGNIDRLHELLAAEPDLAKFTKGGYTPLMWLPDDEGLAIKVAELLIAHGVDPAIRNPEGKTAADYARRRGMEELAALLTERASRS